MAHKAPSWRRGLEPKNTILGTDVSLDIKAKIISTVVAFLAFMYLALEESFVDTMSCQKVK